MHVIRSQLLFDIIHIHDLFTASVNRGFESNGLFENFEIRILQSSRCRKMGIHVLLSFSRPAHIPCDCLLLLFQLHHCYFIMSEGRRGRRPPLTTTNVAQVTHVASTEGAPSTALDAKQVPRALVEVEQTEASGKGVVY